MILQVSGQIVGKFLFCKNLKKILIIRIFEICKQFWKELEKAFPMIYNVDMFVSTKVVFCIQNEKIM